MPERITVAKVSEVPENGSRAFACRDRMIAIFHKDGQYYATDDFCPHMGASLADGWIYEGTVACPWHAWRFSLADGCWLDNPKIRVDIFPVFIVGDEIQVELPDAA